LGDIHNRFPGVTCNQVWVTCTPTNGDPAWGHAVLACYYRDGNGNWQHFLFDPQTDLSTTARPGQVTNLSNINGQDISDLLGHILVPGYSAGTGDGVGLRWGGQNPWIDGDGTARDHSRQPIPR
jgi:hypothetical protein